MHDYRQYDSNDEKGCVVEDRVSHDLRECGVTHHVLSQYADDSLAEENWSVKGMSGDGVDDEEPECNGSCADEAGDHAFTQKVVRPLSHRFPEWLRSSVLRGKYPTAGYIPSELRVIATVRISLGIFLAVAPCAAFYFELGKAIAPCEAFYFELGKAIAPCAAFQTSTAEDVFS